MRGSGAEQPPGHLALHQVDAGEQHGLADLAVAPAAHALAHLLDDDVAVDGGADLAGVDHDLGRRGRVVGDRPVVAADPDHDVAGLQPDRLLAVRADPQVAADHRRHRQRRLVLEPDRPRLVEQDPEQEGAPGAWSVEQSGQSVHAIMLDDHVCNGQIQPWILSPNGD